MAVSRYRTKRALLAPYAAYKRKQYGEDLDHVTRAILESQYYRKTIYDFMRATIENPDILVEVDVDASSIVLDVGAYVGSWSGAISQRYGSTIYAYEPNPASHREMERRIGEQQNVHAFNFGLGASDMTVPLALEGPGSTIYAAPDASRTTEAQIRDVAAVLEELDLDHIDLCKVNIEGGEYDLFDRLIGTDWLPNIRLCLIQFHEWLPKAYARRRAIRRALSRTHDEVWNYPFVWELWRRRDPRD